MSSNDHVGQDAILRGVANAPGGGLTTPRGFDNLPHRVERFFLTDAKSLLSSCARLAKAAPFLANHNRVRGILRRVFEIGKAHQAAGFRGKPVAQSGDILRRAVVDAVHGVAVVQERIRNFRDDRVTQPPTAIDMKTSAPLTFFRIVLDDTERDPARQRDQSDSQPA